MKKIKEKIKIILIILIISMLVGEISVYATTKYLASEVKYKKNDGTEISVEGALNELYNKNTNAGKSYVKKIWASSDASINYTYEVKEKGIYLIGFANCNDENVAATITTDSKVITGKTIQTTTFYSTIKVIDSNVGDKITLNGYNYWRFGANAFISKLENINVSEIIASDIKNDNYATCSYTATSDNEKILIVSFSNATNRSNLISYDGVFTTTFLHDNDDYIDYSTLNKNTTVNASSYGYNCGGGSVFILK